MNGQLAASMWQAETGQHVDGVMAVDVVALTQLLAVTGPVTLPDGKVINSSNAEQFLLHDQYNGLSYTGTNAAEAVREEQQGALAEAEFNALDTESLDLKTLSDALAGMVAGRHILVWSTDPATEDSWRATGVAGNLSADSTLVAVLNRGGNKLDPYLQVSCTLQIAGQGGSGTTGTLTVRMVNTTPSGQGYVGGPYPGLGTVYGEYPGLLAVNLPAAARHLRVTEGNPASVLGVEGPAWVLVTPVDMKAGQSETDVIHFDLPASGSTTVLSSARVPGESWHYDGRTFTDTASHTLTW